MWGSLLGAGMGLLGGMFSKKKAVNDPLAGVRSQLMALSSQVPGMVARQKELIGKNIAEARTTGMGNIQEQMHAEKGFGASSIEPKLTTDLLNKLTQTQAEQDLAAEQWGVGQQASILGQVGGLPFPEEEKSPWAAIGESLGGAFGGGGKNDLSNILAGTRGGADTAYANDLEAKMKLLPSSTIVSEGGGGLFQNLAKSIGGWGK